MPGARVRDDLFSFSSELRAILYNVLRQLAAVRQFAVTIRASKGWLLHGQFPRFFTKIRLPLGLYSGACYRQAESNLPVPYVA